MVLVQQFKVSLVEVLLQRVNRPVAAAALVELVMLGLMQDLGLQCLVVAVDYAYRLLLIVQIPLDILDHQLVSSSLAAVVVQELLLTIIQVISMVEVVLENLEVLQQVVVAKLDHLVVLEMVTSLDGVVVIQILQKVIVDLVVEEEVVTVVPVSSYFHTPSAK